MTYDASSGKAIVLHILFNYNSHTSMSPVKQQTRIDIVF